MAENEAGKARRYDAPRVMARWSAEMRSGFLDHLAATCNVTASARSIGVSVQQVYHLRRTDTRFRAAWLLAIESGYQMLETQLIGHALSGGGPVLTNGDVETTGPIDVQLAQALLTAHRGRMTGAVQAAAPRYKVVTPEQTDASILRKLKAMQRARTRSA